jgi:hypothetical protein
MAKKPKLLNVITKEITDAYLTAISGKYDITSTESVLEMLKVTNPKDASEEKAVALSGMLQIFDRMVKQKLAKKQAGSKKVHVS